MYRIQHLQDSGFCTCINCKMPCNATCTKYVDVTIAIRVLNMILEFVLMCVRSDGMFPTQCVRARLREVCV